MKFRKIVALLCLCAYAVAVMSGCIGGVDEKPTEATESGYFQPAN